jgi:integrase/recombinase XerD
VDAEIAAYLAILRGAQRAQTARVLRRLVSELRKSGITTWRSVGSAQLHGFVRTLGEARIPPLRPWTIYDYTSSVRSFFRFLMARGRILLDPAESLRLRTPRRLPRRVPSEAELRRLLEEGFRDDSLALRDRAVIELLYGTGIRCGECVGLELEDVDLRGGRLFVRLGKGGRARVVPLVGQARAALEAYLGRSRARLAARKYGGGTALFLSRTGKRLGRDGIHFAILRARNTSGGEAPLTPHLLRHACATHLLAGGADIRHVQTLLGHRSIETTALYTKVEAGVLRRAIEEAHPLGAAKTSELLGRRRAKTSVFLRQKPLRGAFVRPW